VRIQKSKRGGKACPHLMETETCQHDKPCPVDCRMGDWGGWAKCDKSCGGGVTKRTRQVVAPKTFGGHRCPAWLETDSCNADPCPVDCKLSDWSQWSQCSRSCNGGTSFRRKELLVLPAYGGIACDANLMESRVCNPHRCKEQECHVHHVRCELDHGHVEVTHDKFFQKVEGNFKCGRNAKALCANGLYGNAREGTQCVFPFSYQGKTYDKCIGTAYGGGGWCSTDPVFKGSWGGCQQCVGCTCRCTHHPGCCAHKDYVLKNAQIFANMYKNIESYHGCCGLCTNHPKCTAWEYNSNHVCILKTGTPVFEKSEVRAGGYTTWAGERSSPTTVEICGGDFLEHPAGYRKQAERMGFGTQMTKFWTHLYDQFASTATKADRKVHGVDKHGVSVQWNTTDTGKLIRAYARRKSMALNRENPFSGKQFNTLVQRQKPVPPAPVPVMGAVLSAAEAAP
jgi:hypothetical protein